MTIGKKTAAGLGLLLALIIVWLVVNTYLSIASIALVGQTASPENTFPAVVELGSGAIVAPVALSDDRRLTVRLRGVEQSNLDAFGKIAQRQIADLTNNRGAGGWVRMPADLSQAFLEVWEWRGGEYAPLEIPLSLDSSQFRDYVQPVAESMQEEIEANYEAARIDFHRLLVDNENRAGDFIAFETHFSYTERLETLDEAYVDDVPEWRVSAHAFAGRY